MRIFLAGLAENFPMTTDIYRLESYLVARNLQQDFSKYKDFILDSGAFSFLNGKDISNIDFEKYAVEYANFVKTKRIKNYIELDLDKILGLDNVEYLRKKINSIVGWRCMPVWHISRGYEYWLKQIHDYDYCCIGGFAIKDFKKKNFHHLKTLLKDAKKTKCKVHGLGFTYTQLLKEYKFYSVDSTTWLVGSKFGNVCLFTQKGMVQLYKKDNSKKTIIERINEFNFRQWVLFQKWADLNL